MSGSNFGVLGPFVLGVVLLVPPSVSFLLGRQSGEVEQGEALAQGESRRQRAIAAALSEERGATAKLRAKLQERERALAGAAPAALTKLKRELEQRQRRIKPGDALVVDTSLTLSELLLESCRRALGEDLAGASIAVIKGSRNFLLQVTFPEGPAAEPAALAPLAQGLSALPNHVQSHWLAGVFLQGPQANPKQPLFVPLRALSPEAWGALLEGFQEPHRLLDPGMPRRNSNLYRIGAISVSHSLEVETAFELWGPKRVTLTLRPGGSNYERIPGGLYVFHTRAEGQLPWLGVMEVRAGHKSELYLKPGR